MANWKEYTTKTTPEDADEIVIADTKANANKRTPFSGLWNWIANKLATAVISQLETQNKSIIPALNELNSKALPVDVALLYIPDTGGKTTYSISAKKATGTITKISGGIFENISVVPTDTTIKFYKTNSSNGDAFTVSENNESCTITVNAYTPVTILYSRRLGLKVSPLSE